VSNVKAATATDLGFMIGNVTLKPTEAFPSEPGAHNQPALDADAPALSKPNQSPRGRALDDNFRDAPNREGRSFGVAEWCCEVDGVPVGFAPPSPRPRPFFPRAFGLRKELRLGRRGCHPPETCRSPKTQPHCGGVKVGFPLSHPSEPKNSSARIKVFVIHGSELKNACP
jgi:hypothetical protein